MEAARRLYSLLGGIVAPLLPLRLWWRGRKEPGYRQAVGERFGRYGADAAQAVLWVHAVSAGETRAAAPLVERLLRAYPDAPILLTHMTATGREAGRSLFGDRVQQCWLPYDLPFAVRRFYAHFEPRAGLLMETELWPNLIAEGARRGVPLFLLNARLSERSARGYRRASWLTRPMLQRLAGIAAQSEADAGRLEALGAPPPTVTGNLKFDVPVTAGTADVAAVLAARIGTGRRVWVAASTRDGEERLILDALRRHPLRADALLILVPRHPQRFDDVAALLASRGVVFVRRSGNAPVTAAATVVLGDSMGEMTAYLSVATLAFIGGSLLPLGGQNLIEALALGKPVLMGPHMFNFADAAKHALLAGAAEEVNDADRLVLRVGTLLDDGDRRAAMEAAALRFHAAHAGAVDRTWSWLEPRLSPRVRD